MACVAGWGRFSGAGIPAPAAAAPAPAGRRRHVRSGVPCRAAAAAPGWPAPARRASTWRPTRSAARVAHSTRFHTASGPSHSSARSGQPAGEGAACTRWPRAAMPPSALRSNGRSPRPSRRALLMTNSSGVFSLAGTAVQASGACTKARNTSARSPSLRRQALPAAPPGPAVARRPQSGAPAWCRRSARWTGAAPGCAARRAAHRALRHGPGPARSWGRAGGRRARSASPGPRRAGPPSASSRTGTRQPVSTAAKAVTSAWV